MKIEAKTRVKNSSTGKLGVVVPDMPPPLDVCESGVMVSYDNEEGADETACENLEQLGPESATPDYDKCGGGKGEKCCIFLTMGPDGFCCERHSSLRWSLIFKTGMSAKREPLEPYPECMDQGGTEC